MRSIDHNGDLFSDFFDSKTSIYESYDTGIALTLNRSWTVYPHYDNFPADLKGVARKMRESDTTEGINGEMMMIAQAPSKFLGLRIIAEELPVSLAMYHEAIRESNRSALLASSEEMKSSIHFKGREAIKWDYKLFNGSRYFRYREYQMQNGIFNFRITFWTLPSKINSVENEIQQVLKSVKFTAKNLPNST